MHTSIRLVVSSTSQPSSTNADDVEAVILQHQQLIRLACLLVMFVGVAFAFLTILLHLHAHSPLCALLTLFSVSM